VAVAFQSIGAVATAYAPVSGALSVPTPPTFVAGNLLLMALQFDCNANERPPFGWTFLGRWRSGTSGGSLAPAMAAVYYRIADGTEGVEQFIYLDAEDSWPKGDPTVAAFIWAYSGVSASGPIDNYRAYTVTAGGADAQAHPQLTTSQAGEWVLTLRFRNGPGTTCSVSPADTVRINSSQANELSYFLADSGSLSAGVQTQRQTTAVHNGTSMGDVMLAVSIVPGSSAGETTAFAQTASASGTVPAAAVIAVAQPWSTVCTTQGYPQYSWATDWSLNGFDFIGAVLSTNPYPVYGLSGWNPSNCTLQWMRRTSAAHTVPFSPAVPCALVTPNGTSATGGVNLAPTPAGSVVPGNSYAADCWVYSPPGWTDIQACIDWYTSTGAFISTSTGSANPVGTGAWTRSVQAFTAPAGASSGVARARHSGTPASSAAYYVWGLMLLDPTLPATGLRIEPGNDILPDLLDPGITFTYGRDQQRQTTPAQLGSASYTLNNSHRTYSPSWSSSPLAGTLDSARPTAGFVTFAGTAYPLFHGQINGYTVTADKSNRTVAFTLLDDEGLFQATKIITPLYSGIRTGDAVNHILDAVGWTGPRNVDPGATVMPWWWLDGTASSAAGSAINDLVASEGPPSIAFIAPDGTFTFQDRDHRLLNPRCQTPQGYFQAGEAFDCASPAPTGLSFTPPFTYDDGWLEIVNSVPFSVGQRAVAQALSPVWSTTSTYAISNGTSLLLAVQTSDPFLMAQIPVAGTDYQVTSTGAGTASVTLSQTSGAAVTVMVQAVGGDIVVTGMQLQAYTVPVVTTVAVLQQDTGSMAEHGEQDYTGSCPWAGVEDANAIGEIILLHYAQRRPTVQLRVVSGDPVHYMQVVGRQISDMVSIENDELGLNSDFFVETITHTVQRMNEPGLPPVHAVVLGCEAAPYASTNPFTFDQRGAGFDAGVFDPPSSDSAATVFVFDSPTNGQFDVNLLGT